MDNYTKVLISNPKCHSCYWSCNEKGYLALFWFGLFQINLCFRQRFFTSNQALLASETLQQIKNFDPRVLHDLWRGVSLLWIDNQHASDQVLQISMKKYPINLCRGRDFIPIRRRKRIGSCHDLLKKLRVILRIERWESTQPHHYQNNWIFLTEYTWSLQYSKHLPLGYTPLQSILPVL